MSDYVTPLQAYLNQNEASQRQSMGNLQQAGTLQALLDSEGKRQREAALRKSLAESGGDPEVALKAALQAGDIAAAHQLAPLVESKRKATAQQAVQGLDLEKLLDNPQAALQAQTMNPHIGPELERLRKVRENNAARATMQSRPAIAPDPQENAQAADQGTPQVAQVPEQAGVFDALAKSEIPAIANQARTMQARLNAPGNAAVPASHWIDMQKQLAAQEGKILETRAAATDRNTRPQSDLGKLKADLAAGRISREDYDAAVGKKTGKAETNLSPEALDQAAARYAIDGTLPPNLGRGAQGAANTALILNKAAEKAKEAGDEPEAARLRQISNKASATALGQLVKQKNLVLAFEKNAVMNADLALKASEEVDRLGSPIIDRWIQAGKKNVAGDVSVAKLDAAIRTFVNEYARVTTSVTGGGVTSDSSRKEIDELLRGAHTKDQVREVIGLMKQEMENRRKGYEAQEAELKAGITGAAPKAAPETPPAAPDAASAGPKVGDKSKSKSGKPMSWDGQRWVYD